MIPALAGTVLADAPGRPLLLVGPSVGTTVEALWGRCVDRLGGRFHVIGWDLPGHGRSPSPPGPFTVEELARAVLDLAGDAPFRYAGVSLGGATGLALMLAAPAQVQAAVLLCTGARIGTPASWRERAGLVRGSGTAVMIEGSAKRWFAPGFLSREPAAGSALLHALRDTDREGYALACLALAALDLRDRLAEITTPVLAVAGALDEATPPASLASIASGVRYGRLVVLDDTAHQAPAERPDEVAALLLSQLSQPGMAVRRTVLGDAHVDRAAPTPFTAGFQDLISRYAWGEIWTRPGLDRRSRSMITLTALVALGHHEELALHVRAARTNGLTDAEIEEVLLQTAIYCGVPAANTAFRIAAKVLAELNAEAGPVDNSAEVSAETATVTPTHRGGGGGGGRDLGKNDLEPNAGQSSGGHA
ncbi:4-carboxymuconolactone decarboxylase [Actinoplanes sp. NBRC 103695]|uniref:bifunctional 3-oxoadipate enol-lactonase/4-carboxymuconolactone decarboxylase PcaDC n=1 Tax=Actinoplanes sp. NBRC 103695 TaxID=3032202 RepID=UPI0024A49826|nr:4-carboxymuconolactone decarboxylase [Actinoplanes sp. NBRC 103695]GLZ00078.1 3-oxoadipate enol-lactonase [Actinoplanes sp. NBRC 103695]